jgi:solute carrier family 24 (sodium/potassium/calcium exchanger), member 6
MLRFTKETLGASRRLSYSTRFSLVYSFVSILLLVGLSCVPWTDEENMSETKESSFSSPSRSRRLTGDDNYSSYSCHLIHEMTSSGSTEQCVFAKTCGGGEGLWAPIVFCSSHPTVWTAVLAPVMLIWLVVLFRMLGSTAEDFFSPSLEMFSTQLGLPPRFAGVTLLALGNGAADVSATQSAITGDPEHGYQLSLGALTGAAMMIGSVVSAMVILTAEGVPCRGALVRDVVALLLTVVLVWRCLSSGSVTPETITIFLSFYCIFVMLVLVADVYHRRIVVPRLSVRTQEAERQRQLDQADEVRQRESGVAGSKLSHVITALSNYDNDDGSRERTRESDGWGIESDVLETDRPILLHGSQGLLSHAHHGNRLAVNTASLAPGNEAISQHGNYTALQDPALGAGDSVDGLPSIIPELTYQPWNSFVDQARDELMGHFMSLWDDIYWNADVNYVDKVLMTIELPVMVLRKCTVAIPCEGYYVRSLVALALAFSPLWVAFYLWRSNEVVVFGHGFFYAYWAMALISALGFARLAPVNDSVRIRPWVSVPIALYGFAIAASWIDTIADALVSLLNFIGILLSIPSSVLGLTLLAWGNSMSDLSADITMARKGLANMAMTACFAGPVFNILVGLGLGFSSLAAQTGQSEREVVLSPSVLTGFAFVAAQCLCILTTGVFLFRARIPRSFGYVSLTIYVVYVVSSIALQYSKFGADDEE